jgi:hypothetical protein
MSQVMQVIIGAFGAVMVATAVLLFLEGGPTALSGIYPLILGLIAIAVALFERSRYWPGRGQAHDPGLRPTDERFIDPTTGERTRVWIDPSSGERTYRPDE